MRQVSKTSVLAQIEEHFKLVLYETLKLEKKHLPKSFQPCTVVLIPFQGHSCKLVDIPSLLLLLGFRCSSATKSRSVLPSSLFLANQRPQGNLKKHEESWPHKNALSRYRSENNTIQCCIVRYTTGQWSIILCNTITNTARDDIAWRGMTIYMTLQHSTVQQNTVKYSTVQYNTVQYNTVQYNTRRYKPPLFNITRYSTALYNTTQYKTTQHWQQCCTASHRTDEQSRARKCIARHFNQSSVYRYRCPVISFLTMTCSTNHAGA